MEDKKIIIEINEDGSFDEAERVLAKLRGVKNRFLRSFPLTFEEIEAERKRIIKSVEEEFLELKEDIEFRYPVSLSVTIEYVAPDGSWGIDLTGEDN